jgi:transposase
MDTIPELALDARQQRAAVLLASGCNSGLVAEELKIHRSTLAKWQNRPEFEAFVNQLKEEGRAAARAKMIGLAEKAVSTMAELLDSDNERIRLAAASDILRHLADMPIGSSSVAEIKSHRALEELGSFG